MRCQVSLVSTVLSGKANDSGFRGRNGLDLLSNFQTVGCPRQPTLELDAIADFSF